MWQTLSIRSQMMIGLALLISIIEALTLGFTYWSDSEERRALAIEQTQTLSRALNQDLLRALLNPQVTEYSDIAFRLSGFGSVSGIALLNKENQIVFQYLNPESRIAFDNASSIGATATFSGNLLYMRQGLTSDGYEYGSVVYAIDLTRYNTRLREQVATLALSFPVLLSIGLALAWWFSRRFTQPVTELAQAIKNSDVLNNRFELVSTHAKNEIAVMYNGYNEMVQQIERSTRELRFAIDTRDKADQANQAKSSFLANMSHELRTPLNAILGYSEIIKEEAADIKQMQIAADAEKIRASGQYLLSLIHDLLDLSKIEAGKLEMDIEPASLKDIVADVMTTIRPLVEGKGNTLTVSIDDDIDHIHTDITRVRQVLINLLSNANKFTARGQLALRIGSGEHAGIPCCFIQIKDSGIGMTPAQLARLFQPFSQASSDTARKFGGTGLGLVISKRFCELLGGDIEVNSVAGQGSTFTVRLPRGSAGLTV